MGPKPEKSLDLSLDTSLEEMDSETTVKEHAIKASSVKIKVLGK